MTAFVASFLVAISSLSATEEGPQWNRDYAVALEATRTSQRPLLVLIDKPAAPQEGAGEAVMQPDEALQKVLAGYTLCYIDASGEYGQSVADVFDARQFPFAAVIDRQGKKVLDKWSGTRNATQWLEALGGPAERGDMVDRGQNDEESSITRTFRRGRSARPCST